MARWTAAIISLSLLLPDSGLPISQQPNPMAETLRPVLPSLHCCTLSPPVPDFWVDEPVGLLAARGLQDAAHNHLGADSLCFVGGAGGGDLALFQRRIECVFVDEDAPRSIDQDSRRLHQGQPFTVDEPPVGSFAWRVQGHVIAAPEKVLQFNQLDVPSGTEVVVGVGL